MVQVTQKNGLNLENFSKKELICIGAALLLGMTTQAIGANGLPFYDKLEFGITIVKTIGGAIAILSLLAALYMQKQGRSEGFVNCIWFCLVGILTANIEWAAEQFGFLQGVLIV